jgi:hypothetical protein
LLHAVFNYGEAVFWCACAITFFIHAGRGERRGKRDQLILGFAFVGFGLSDWIEVDTGAWWRPWWLLALKAICLLIILRSFWKLWPLLSSKAGRRDDQK